MTIASHAERSPAVRFLARHVLGAMDGRGRRCLHDPEALVQASRISSGARVLEIWCGSGFFTPALSAPVCPAGAVEAVDKEPLAVEVTEAKVRALGLTNVHVGVADAHRTTFPDGSFDAAIVYGVVPGPGIIDERRLALELRRPLRPGGRPAFWTMVPPWRPRAFERSGVFVQAGRSLKVSGRFRA